MAHFFHLILQLKIGVFEYRGSIFFVFRLVYAAHRNNLLQRIIFAAKSAFLKIFGFFPALLYETKPEKR